MENTKFKFKSTTRKNPKETEKNSEKENFSIEESKKYYTDFMLIYNSTNIPLNYILNI
jgi:hypothetical protein